MKKDIFYKSQIEGLLDVEETIRIIEKSAASSVHFLEKRVKALDSYKSKIQTALYRLSRFYWDVGHPLLKERVEGKRTLLVLTGTKGIVGGLYHELINEVLVKKDNYEYIWIFGNRGKGYLEEENIQAEEFFGHLNFDGLFWREEIGEMSADLFERFQKFNLKKIDVLYPEFLSFAQQSPNIVQFLPFSFARGGPSKLKEENTRLDDESENGLPIFEPSKKMIFDTLIKKYINIAFMDIILEAKLSEFSARMIIAESGAKETERLIHLFNRNFVKAKHLAITQKQVESFSVHQIIKQHE